MSYGVFAIKMILRHYVNLLENNFRGKDPICRAENCTVLYCTVPEIFSYSTLFYFYILNFIGMFYSKFLNFIMNYKSNKTTNYCIKKNYINYL